MEPTSSRIEKCKQFGYIKNIYENYAHRTLCLKLDIYISCNYTCIHEMFCLLFIVIYDNYTY